MAITRRQNIVNSTAPVVLKLDDIDSGAPFAPDSLPYAEVYDPTGRRVVYNQPTVSIGGGHYLLDVPARATALRGYYMVIFTYLIDRKVYKQDGTFEVVGGGI